MPDPGREFLLRVHSSPEGWKATVQPVVVFRGTWRRAGREFTGHGATEVAACLAALVNARLDSPRSPDAV